MATTTTTINNQKWCKLFYDKYAGDHHYDNKTTKDVTISDLEDGSYTVYSNKDAIEFYNKMFTGHFELPQFLSKSNSLYKLNIYTKLVDGIQTVYTIININQKLLEQIIVSKKEIDNLLFLKNLCRYHVSYTNSNRLTESIFNSKNSTGKDTILLNSDFIMKHTMTPVDYTFHTRIEHQNEIIEQLYDYQKCSINWMIEKETNPITIHYNMNEEVVIGNVYFDTYNHTFNLLNSRKSLTFAGGGLIDEVGLGKTVQIIELTIKNPATVLSYTREGDNKKLYSRATLIICPNQLCKQWEREITKMVSKEYDPVVYTILTKTHFDKYTYQDLLDADFVIVSFTFLENKVFTQPWTGDITTSKSFTKSKWSATDKSSVETIFGELGKKLVSNGIQSITESHVLFQLIHWHRLVVDEFHEINTNKKYVSVENIVPFIQSKYRWLVTATPFIQTTHSVVSSLNFLTNYKNTDGTMILTNSKFVDYLSVNCFRRNTKDSVKEEHTLPPVQEEIKWLKFSPTERMMYNAHLANSNNDRFGVYLRQLCCHPQLADETRMALSNCKSLADIEKMMVAHYKTDVDNATIKVKKVQKRIRKNKQKLLKFRKRQYKYTRATALKNKQLAKLLQSAKNKHLDCTDSDSDSDFDADLLVDDFEDNNLNNLQDDDLLVVDGEDVDVSILNEDPVAVAEENAKILEDTTALDQKIQMFYNLTNIKVSSSAGIESLKEALKKADERLIIFNKDLEGKTTTYNFFNNVIERLRKTTAKDTGGKNNKIAKELESGTSTANMFNLDSDTEEEDEDDEKCAVCLDSIAEDDVGVTKCGHIFCYECIKTWLNKSNACPYCKMHLTSKDIFILSYEKKKKVVSPEDVKRDDFINEVGTKLANLIFFLRESDKHTIIFSQWDDLLRRVGRILKDNGIKNVFCKGNCYQRDKAIREFNDNDSIKVIMLSSDSAASGTNLTKASQVIFLDPIYGDYKYRKGQEAQAIGRAHRMGQKKTISVVRLIVKETVEEEIYKLNLKEDEKVESEKTNKVVITDK